MTHNEEQHEQFERSLRMLGVGIDPDCVVNSMLFYLIDLAAQMDDYDATQVVMSMAKVSAVIAHNIDGDDETDEDEDEDGVEQDEA